jgi:hypothetical protein
MPRAHDANGFGENKEQRAYSFGCERRTGLLSCTAHPAVADRELYGGNVWRRIYPTIFAKGAFYQPDSRDIFASSG